MIGLLAVAIVPVAPGLEALAATPLLVDQQESAGDATPQVDLRDLIARVLGRETSDDSDKEEEPEPDGDATFLLFPTFGGNPAVGVAVGVVSSLTDYWGDPTTTPLSSVNVSASFTTRKQVIVVARSDIYAPDDRWHLLGDWRFYKFLERTHGLGSDAPALSATDIDYTWYRLHETVYRPVWAGLEIGGGYHLDVHADVRLDDDQPEAVLQAPATPPLESTTSSGVSANLLFDRRDNPLNPDRGVYGRASYTFFRTALGSDADWSALQLDARTYHKLPGTRRQILAFWALGWMTRAAQDDVPYFDLPYLGGDTYGRTGRGYRTGRFRGKDWIYAEMEYRADLTRNGLIGVVAFLNASTLSDFATGDFQRWVPGGGVGVRLKLDKDRRSNLSVDVAWGRDGSRGVFLALNEAF